jgi:DNA-directed RNA polymerase sigma subunit (sigma70/sigma32)
MTNPRIDHTERDRKIVALKAGNPKLSNDAIGGEYGISRERVRQILMTARRQHERTLVNQDAVREFREAIDKFEKLRSGRPEA